jgi:hypothetical protein
VEGTKKRILSLDVLNENRAFTLGKAELRNLIREIKGFRRFWYK